MDLQSSDMLAPANQDKESSKTEVFDELCAQYRQNYDIGTHRRVTQPRHLGSFKAQLRTITSIFR